MPVQTKNVAESATLTIRRPDDFHVHFRDGEMLKVVAPYTARQFSRAVVMPNLKPPVRTLAEAVAYRDRILAAVPEDLSFTPLMTLYLTDKTSPEDIREAHSSGLVKSCKLYPAGATTNSALGVSAMENVYNALQAMEKVGMVLCIHGESTSPDVDIFDKEAEFVKYTMPKILSDFPSLKIVLEHVTTADAVDFVKSTPGNRLAATITAHHLLYSRQDIFSGAKIHPHMFCLPILKRETHRQALLTAIADDDEGKFFAGTDSAPHVESSKICGAGCAGVFTGMCALELYAEALEEAGALSKLEAFLSENGARFYGINLNEGTITLERTARTIPTKLSVPGSEPVVPLRSGELVNWTVKGQ
eukprot:GFKZ01007973.1.p1 GENE.GFKZ01007973.1~~GFKZ01007973.1.p1  ORF type:complete len:360 (-),score=43.21 GFKZ01007973.1:1518-2597(-)